MGRHVVGAIVAGTVVLATAGAALAVSDGNYDYEKQHCSAYAANSERAGTAEPGCRTVSAVVWTGPDGGYSRDNEVASAGILQAPDGSMPHEPDYTTPQDGAAGHAAEGVHAYFGADDNLDVGEHDSSELVDNGPSDGGGIRLDADPATVREWVDALMGGDTQYLLTRPVPLVSAGAGAGADGVMFSVQTDRQVAWRGTGSGARDVADYDGKQWDPETCSGPSDGSAKKDRSCDDPGTKGRREDIADWEAKEGATYAEPGVQVYEDPDPQASPAGPYPLPAAYAGTCGVVLGGGALAAPASPVTNRAGQVVVETGCG